MSKIPSDCVTVTHQTRTRTHGMHLYYKPIDESFIICSFLKTCRPIFAYDIGPSRIHSKSFSTSSSKLSRWYSTCIRALYDVLEMAHSSWLQQSQQHLWKVAHLGIFDPIAVGVGAIRKYTGGITRLVTQKLVQIEPETR